MSGACCLSVLKLQKTFDCCEPCCDDVLMPTAGLLISLLADMRKKCSHLRQGEVRSPLSMRWPSDTFCIVLLTLGPVQSVPCIFSCCLRVFQGTVFFPESAP